MINIDTISETIATYKKHGWILRRVLLSAALSGRIDRSRSTLFGNVEVFDSDIDAAWFSRQPTSGEAAWEIRFLGETPVALVERIDEFDPDFENHLKAVEGRLREMVATRKRA